MDAERLQRNDINEERTILNEFMTCRESLIYVSFGITKNYQDAEEIVWKTLVHLLEKLKGGTLPIMDLNYSAYLYTSVRNASLDKIRDKRRRDQAIVKFDCNLTTGPKQEDEVNLKELMSLFEQALGMIKNEDHKDILKLRIVDGMEYTEIAEKMDTPIGTVMSRLSRARDSIHAVLSGNKRFADLQNFDIL